MSSLPPSSRLLTIALHVLRGFLIGLAELVPGVSGGTVALITGVYERIIASASHVIGAVRVLVRPSRSALVHAHAPGEGSAQLDREDDGGTYARHDDGVDGPGDEPHDDGGAEQAADRPGRWAAARAEFAQVQWSLVIPLVLGMLVAVFAVAGVAERLVSSYPEQARGLFFGLVAASLIVPLRIMPARRHPGAAGMVRDLALVLGAAALAAWLVGLAAQSASAEPPSIVVFFAAAVAICALVVPGVSGSFFLLAIGLYSATLTAVSERDFAYLGIFFAGAVVGMVSIVQVLRYLLERFRRVTLLVMTGLMAGSLRALWPWQVSELDELDTGTLLAPQEPLAAPILFALLGAAIVMILILIDTRSKRSTAAGRIPPERMR